MDMSRRAGDAVCQTKVSVPWPNKPRTDQSRTQGAPKTGGQMDTALGGAAIL
jgi:hypothetical protein